MVTFCNLLYFTVLFHHYHQGAVEIASITLEPITVRFNDGTDPSEAVTVVVTAQGERSSVTAQWMVEDVETAYLNYKWAIGYVPGMYYIDCSNILVESYPNASPFI